MRHGTLERLLSVIWDHQVKGKDDFIPHRAPPHLISDGPGLPRKVIF